MFRRSSRRLPTGLDQEMQQPTVVHVFDGRQVDPDDGGGGGGGRQVDAELREETDGVHRLPGERVAQSGAGDVALRPGAVVKATVRTSVAVVTDVVHVVRIEEYAGALLAGNAVDGNGGKWRRRLVLG